MSGGSKAIVQRTKELARELRVCTDEKRAQAIRDEMVSINEGLVVNAAKKFMLDYVRKNREMRENLLSAGRLGLIEAIASYDPDRGDWSVYTLLYIKKHILEEVRQVEYPGMSRDNFWRRQEVIELADDYEVPLNHIQEITDRYNDEVRKPGSQKIVPHNVELILSYRTNTMTDTTDGFVRHLADDSVNVEDEALLRATDREFAEVAEQVWRAVERLSPKQRDAILSYYRDGKNSMAVCDEEGVSAGAIRNRRTLGFSKLREQFTSRDLEVVRQHLAA